MKKLLFLHGFYASGQCIPALALRESFEGRVEVLSPDLPMHPKEAIEFIRELIDHEKPDLMVGNSCGAFYAQMMAPIVGIPALLGNPHFQMTEFLKQRVGEQEYKSPRKDGIQKFVIDDVLIDEFAELEAIQFNYCNPYYKDRIWGLFGEQDTLAHFEPLFLEHYNQSFHFPGGHTPTAEEVHTWYLPLAEKMVMNFPLPEDGIRYFQHFKGGHYSYVRTAFDSETQERIHPEPAERMVIYQALYGDKQYWVRPEKMFFETVTRDGRKFSRFTEIDKQLYYASVMIDQIINYNKTFVEQKGYEKYITDKYPDKKLAVLLCMDTRLTELLPAALGLKNGDAKIIKNAGGLVISAFDSAMRSLIVAIYELGVEEIMVVAHSHCGACHMSYDHFHHEMIARGVTDDTLATIRKCGIDLDQWLEGFKDTPTSVRKTVETIKTHPLVPKDIVVRGFIIDSETGALEEII